MTENLVARLKRHEGLRLFPYTDTEGKLTIGYGRCLSTHGISQQEAEDMLESDINVAQAGVMTALPWTTNIAQIRQEILTEMCFQLGLAGLLEFKAMLTALQKGDYDGAAQAMLDSLWAKQVPERAEELSGMMVSGAASR